MHRRKLAIALCVSALGVATVAAAPRSVTRLLSLGDLRLVSTAQASTPLTLVANAVDTANQELASVQGQVTGWQVAGASFVPALTQVTDPGGNVGYKTSAPYNAWVVLFSAPQQCGWNTYEGWVIVDDDDATPTYTSVLATHPIVQAGNTCSLQDAGAVPPPDVPSETIGTGPLGPGALPNNCGAPLPPTNTVGWAECKIK